MRGFPAAATSRYPGAAASGDLGVNESQVACPPADGCSCSMDRWPEAPPRYDSEGEITMVVRGRRKPVRSSLAALIAVALATGLGGAPAPVSGQPSGDLDPLGLVDPELRAVAEALSSGDFSSLGGGGQAAPAREALVRTIPGPQGAPDVEIRIADPSPGERGRPAYLHMHGGGYMFGNASASFDVADRCECVVVSVEYRLAPGTPFPGSLEDNYAALRWVYDNADELGVDRTRIAIGGESAGGGHAAALAIAARDRGEIPVVFQVLIYPMIDDRTGSGTSVPDHIGTLVWTRDSNRSGWEALLGQSPGLPTVPAGSVPARVEDLGGLPAAWIGVGALDLFVQEDIVYAARLIEAGVPTQLEVVPGAFHAFDLVAPESEVSMRFTESWIAALRRAFAQD